MQHSLAVDHIEGAANSAELADVALRVFDVIRERWRRLAFGVTEPAHAKIDRERARALVTFRNPGAQARAATGSEDIDRLGFSERRKGDGREFVAQVFVDRDRLDIARGLHPAGVGGFFGLLAGALRYLIIDRRKLRN